MAYKCCAPLMLVRPTRGGKLAIQDTFAVLLAVVLGLPLHLFCLSVPIKPRRYCKKLFWIWVCDLMKLKILWYSKTSLKFVSGHRLYKIILVGSSLYILPKLLASLIFLTGWNPFLHSLWNDITSQDLLFQHLMVYATTGKKCIPVLLLVATFSTNILPYLELLLGLTMGNSLNCLRPGPCLLCEVLWPSFLWYYLRHSFHPC